MTEQTTAGTKEKADAKEYLAAIVTSSDDAIISKDLSGHITSWNKSAERIFGYSADEAIGKHISLLIPPEFLTDEDYILGQIKAGLRIDHFETVRRHKSGLLVHVSITVSPIRDSSGTVIGASKVARDISERLKMEVALKDLNRRKDEFLANISHELRTPMNAVIGLASLLQQSKSLGERDRQFVDTLKLSADSLMDLINDILDFAKIESGMIHLEEAEFNLNEQVENAINIIKVKAREKNLALNVSCDPAVNRFFKGDRLRLHQILMNLLSNAVKFTDKGSIDVMVRAKAGDETSATMVSFSIKDTGIGIPYDKQVNIFEKFTQGDSSITRRYGGTGLGLAICKSLAELMGGGIALESEPGIGSTFTVHLPFKRGGQTGGVAITNLFEENIIRKEVLLVEDYEPSVMVASAMLDQFGYHYDVARNGFDALKKFRDGKYDVILMDVQMNEMDGLETTRRIRRLEKEKGAKPVPIIAMTAHVREQDKWLCIGAGMDDVITKPFEQATLSKMLLHYTD